MDTHAEKCANVREALIHAENLDRTTCYPIDHVEYPVFCDALAQVSPIYPSPPQEPVQAFLVSSRHSHSVPVEVKSDQPFFTLRTPFLAAAAPDYQIQFHPPPSRIQAVGICYAPQVHYRLLSARHRLGELVYDPPRVSRGETKTVAETQ